jgi:hypothetical protein
MTLAQARQSFFALPSNLKDSVDNINHEEKHAFS